MNLVAHYIKINRIKADQFKDGKPGDKWFKNFMKHAHQGIEENELADSLAKTASKKATQLSPSEIQQGNKMLSISKWTRRWENSKQNIKVLSLAYLIEG